MPFCQSCYIICLSSSYVRSTTWNVRLVLSTSALALDDLDQNRYKYMHQLTTLQRQLLTKSSVTACLMDLLVPLNRLKLPPFTNKWPWMPASCRPLEGNCCTGTQQSRLCQHHWFCSREWVCTNFPLKPEGWVTHSCTQCRDHRQPPWQAKSNLLLCLVGAMPWAMELTNIPQISMLLAL